MSTPAAAMRGSAPPSLRLRFTLAIMLWVAVGIGGIWLSATRVFTKHIKDQYHQELYGHVRELAGLVVIGDGGHVALSRPLSDPRYLEPLSGFYWQVTVDGGDTLRSASMRRGRLDDNVAHSPTVVHAVADGPTGAVIAYGFTGATRDGRVIHYVIATDKRYLDAAVAGFTRELTAWLAALAVALCATGWLVAAVSLKPLDRLAQAMADLRAGRKAPLPGVFPSEITPLVDDLNTYIVENQAIIQRARVQAGNLAHSLRTPLAVITDEAERLEADPGTRASARTVLEQAARMIQQIDFHLARARSAAGATASGQSSKLPEILSPLLAAMRKLHPEVTFTIDHAPGVPVEVPVDPLDLSEVLSILLDNAGKWARNQVAITLSLDDATCRVDISDDGPGMTGPQIESAFAIGVRHDPDRAGAGLGLAIARDIAEAYGFGLELKVGPGGGLTGSVILPVAGREGGTQPGRGRA